MKRAHTDRLLEEWVRALLGRVTGQAERVFDPPATTAPPPKFSPQTVYRTADGRIIRFVVSDNDKRDSAEH